VRDEAIETGGEALLNIDSLFLNSLIRQRKQMLYRD
jgi:hypothetical protein